jgi:hypothetical protein
MFVNVSPASYNRHETSISLLFAERVKMVTNKPTKNIESKEMAKIKQELTDVVYERDKFKSILMRSGMSSDDLDRLVRQ